VLSQQVNLIKSSQAISHVSFLKTANISGIISVTIIRALMMGTEMVPETSAVFNELTWLIAREDFTNGLHIYT